MQLALCNDNIYIKTTKDEYPTVKSLPGVKFDKKNLAWVTPCTLEMLNRLKRLVKLPPALETERQRKQEVQDKVDKERLCEKPKALFDYPVTVKLFEHQIRGANMAMYEFEWDTEEEKAK